jgi:hypothetical protein
LKGLAALGIVVAGAVAGFAGYTFGWRDGGGRQRDSASVSVRGRQVFTVRQGDTVNVPARLPAARQATTEGSRTSSALAPTAVGTRWSSGRTKFRSTTWQATVFPSHHGGFLGGEFGYASQPEAFARKLREVLDDD